MTTISMTPIDPFWVKLGIGAVLITLLVWGGCSWLKHRDAGIATKAELLQTQRTDVAATKIGQDLTAVTHDQAAEATRVETTRIIYRDRYRELRDEDPTVAAFDRTRVPDELRILACERRATRERLDGAEAGCGRLDPAPPANGRAQAP